MALNDATVGAVLFTFEQLIRQLHWTVAAADESPEGLLARDLVKGALFEDMSHTWQDALSEILSMLVYGWCLPPDQIVLDGSGVPVPIASVKVGDTVLTGHGRARTVSRVYARSFTGHLISVKLQGYPDRIRLTPEHQVPTRRGWLRADQVTVGDILLRPRSPLDPGGDYAEGWLVGAFLAEGWGHPGKYRNRFSFGVHRREAEELAGRLNAWAERRALTWDYPHSGPAAKPYARIQYSARHHGAEVRFTHPQLRALLEQWVDLQALRGRRAAGLKRLRQLPTEREFARGLWEGWWWGDGWIRQGVKISGTTTSRALAHQFMLIGGALGVLSPVRRGSGRRAHVWTIDGRVPTPIRRKRTPDAECRARAWADEGIALREIGRRLGVSHSVIAHWLRTTGPATNGLHLTMYDDAVGHRVTACDREAYEGPVYDLEVSDDHTFCAGPVTVSNCYLEIVYKYRGGPGEVDPTRRSRFTDGKLGWRKWAIRAQETLWEWAFDQSGGVQGLWQTPWPGTGQGGSSANVLIPIDKALLFRTRSERNSPEGRSLLRTAYRCFAEDSELLTRQGWRRVAHVGVDDEVATLNAAGEIEYQQPTHIWAYPYAGEMVAARSRFVDQLVTPNHRMWVRRAHKTAYEFIEAAECPASASFRATGVWPAPDQPVVTVGQCEVPADDWYAFLGLWLAEGHAWSNGTRHEIGVVQKPGPKADLIRSLLRRLPWSVYERTDRRGLVRWTFTRRELWAVLAPLGKAKSKRLPESARHAAAAQLSILLDWFHLGDGSIVGDRMIGEYGPYRGTRLLHTASEGLADDLMEAAFLAGFRATKRETPGHRLGGRMWAVTLGKDFPQLRATWAMVPYTGAVYCVTTPNGIVYTRRNGKASWSGNSWYMKKKIEEIEGIGIERDLTGVPVLTPPERGVNPWDDKDPKATAVKEAAERVVRNIKRDEQEGIFKPYGWTLELLTTGGRRQFDTTAIIDRYDTRIAMSCLADFLMLGHQQTGSWALSSDKTELCALAVGGIADGIATVVNRHAVPRLLRLNGLPEALAPTLQHGDLETPDLDALGSFVQRLASVNAIRLTPELETALLEAANLPVPTIQDPTVGKKLRKGVRLTKREQQMVETMAAVREAVTALKGAAVKLAARLPTA